MSNITKDEILTSEERKLGTTKIRPLFFAYTLSAVLGMGMQMAMTIADGFYVGNGVGEIGLGTISVVYPFWIIPIAIGTMIGVGSSTLVGIKLGQGKKDEARAVLGQTFWFTVISSILLTVLILVFLDPILRFFGAEGDIMDSARLYTQVFMAGFPLYVTGLVMFYLVRMDEKPVLAMLIQIVPAVIGLVVEYILIFQMNVGIAGSAIGSWIITFGSWFLLSFHFIFGKTELKIKMKDIKPNMGYIKEIHKIGLAGFIIQVAPTFVAIAINNLIGIHGQESDYAVYGVINAYMLYILTSFTNSFGFGLLPIASYNYGAKLYGRVREVLLISVKYTFGFLVIVLVLIFVFANQILGFFIGPVPDLIAATREAMQVFVLLFPLGAVTLIVSNYFQAVEKNGKAIINSLTRNVVYILPLLFILPRFMGMDGVWMSQPIADFLACATAVFFLVKELKELKAQELL
jgi:putative MATE family efflux protein